jgi:hypothetical protein
MDQIQQQTPLVMLVWGVQGGRRRCLGEIRGRRGVLLLVLLQYCQGDSPAAAAAAAAAAGRGRQLQLLQAQAVRRRQQ